MRKPVIIIIFLTLSLTMFNNNINADWSQMGSGTITDTDLYGVWGSSATDVFAVGYYYNLDTFALNSVILHYQSSCLAELLYGEHSQKTELMRNFRDKILSQTPEGQEIIRLYYQWSSVIVKVMEEDEEFKEDVKEMIDGVLELIAETE